MSKEEKAEPTSTPDSEHSNANGIHFPNGIKQGRRKQLPTKRIEKLESICGKKKRIPSRVPSHGTLIVKRGIRATRLRQSAPEVSCTAPIVKKRIREVDRRLSQRRSHPTRRGLAKNPLPSVSSGPPGPAATRRATYPGLHRTEEERRTKQTQLATPSLCFHSPSSPPDEDIEVSSSELQGPPVDDDATSTQDIDVQVIPDTASWTSENEEEEFARSASGVVGARRIVDGNPG